ncbi:DUF7342 family protein [Halopelagius longus]|uniref:DUF7342 family protein n=1 Tax=Halopelagius longus TaxID=1236180 RepID=UPI001113F4EE|nr:hypothetical protein [Halopelagius longus]
MEAGNDDWSNETPPIERVTTVALTLTSPATEAEIRHKARTDKSTTEAILETLQNLYILHRTSDTDEARWYLNEEFKRFRNVEQVRWTHSLDNLRRFRETLEDTLPHRKSSDKIDLRYRLMLLEDAIHQRESDCSGLAR